MDFVNSDIIRMSKSLTEQASAIGDEEHNADERRRRIFAASAHLMLAFAELLALPPAGSPGRSDC